jgi:FkbM family methyltransferase
MPDLRKVWATVRSHKRPIRYLIALFLVRTGVSRFLKIAHPDFTLRFHGNGHSMALWVDPDCRKEDHDFFHSALRPGDRVIDVGANIGTLALTASRVAGPTGRVVAVEPHPRTFSYLSSNVRLNGCENVELLNVALGDREGTVNLSDDRADDENGVIGPDSPTRLVVPIHRLDDLVTGDQPIALLKIDVEGYEKFVLEGAPRTLSRTSCIYIEAIEALFARYGYSCSDLWALLHSAGFTVCRISGGKRLARLSPHFESTRCENFVAVKDVAAFCERSGFLIGD